MRLELGRVGSKQFEWERLLPLFEKLPRWASYFVAILCSVGMGYSLGSAGSTLPDLREDQITLIVVSTGALLAIFLLGLILRGEERRRAERAEQLRLSKEATAVELLDQVDRHVLDALDEIALVKGVDRAALIPAVLRQYIARKSYEAAVVDRVAQSKGGSNAEPETSSEWFKTLPAWLETLPGSLDVKSR
jgi:4-amino-4-deoxy-L-arabinose transferase-like glycosyltransferase